MALKFGVKLTINFLSIILISIILNKSMKKIKFKYLFINSILCFIFTNNLFAVDMFAVDMQISLFPLDNYNQYTNQWLLSDNTGYNKHLLPPDCQKQCSQEFYNHLHFIDTYSFSTWSRNCIHKIFQQIFQQIDLKTLKKNLIEWYSSRNKDPNYLNYGKNLHPHIKWINDIDENINTNQFSELECNENNQVITVTNLNNLNARVLSIDNMHFYNFTLAGKGHPFDHLQISPLWEGAPICIVAQSKDKARDYVIIPSFISWIHSSGMDPILEDFVYKWSQVGKKIAATELKSTILLPRDSCNQVETAKIIVIDKSSSNLEQILESLVEKERPLMTIVYIHGHILFFPSRNRTIVKEKLMAMIYQNVYELNRSNRERRSVTSKSVLFSLLPQYPEHLSPDSLTNKKYFQVSFLDERSSLLEIPPPFALKQLVHREYMFSNFQNY